MHPNHRDHEDYEDEAFLGNFTALQDSPDFLEHLCN
jgi:hypothetical protein